MFSMDNERPPKGELVTVTNDVIGIGSYTRVYYACDEQGVQYAVKEVSKKQLNYQLVQKYREQGQMMMKINNPYIVKVYRVYENQQCIHFVMEMCGLDLETEVKNNHPSKQRCIEIMQQLCRACYQLTKLQIVHRDIKPSKFVLCNDGKLKLCGLGVTKVFNNPSKNYHKADVYMSPQILKGQSHSVKTDMWSLGITLYWIFFKKYPWGDKIDENYLKKCSQPLNFPHNQLWEQQIMSCLQIDEEKRCNSVALFHTINSQMLLQSQISRQQQKSNGFFKKKFNIEQTIKIQHQHNISPHEKIIDWLITIPNLQKVLRSFYQRVGTKTSQLQEFTPGQLTDFILTFSKKQFQVSEIKDLIDLIDTDHNGNISFDEISEAISNRKQQKQHSHHVDQKNSQVFVSMHKCLQKSKGKLSTLFFSETKEKISMNEKTFIKLLERVEEQSKITPRITLQGKKNIFKEAKNNSGDQIKYQDFKNLFIKMSKISENCSCITFSVYQFDR